MASSCFAALPDDIVSDHVASLGPCGIDSAGEATWNNHYDALVEYRVANGTLTVPSGTALHSWVEQQRCIGQDGRMDPERREKLETIGFSWGFVEAAPKSLWEKQFDKLVAYQAENGDCKVPKVYRPDPSLGIWVKNQRYRHRNGMVKPDERTKLDSLGFEWGKGKPRKSSWSTQYEKLRAFFYEHGHCRVPKVYAKDQALADWVTAQRHNKRIGNITIEQRRKLQKLEFVWLPKRGRPPKLHRPLLKKTKLPMQLRALPTMKSKLLPPPTCSTGTCSTGIEPFSLEPVELAAAVLDDEEYFPDEVALENVEEGDPDAVMMEEIRKEPYTPIYHAPPTMSQKKPTIGKRRLSKVPWELMLEALQRFKSDHGHCSVPRAIDKTLSTWVDTQRSTWKHGTIKPDRFQKLNEMGFTWDSTIIKEKLWNDMFESLCEYKAVHGDCCVPRNYEADPTLAAWVDRNRQQCVRQDRIESLDSIGFDWGRRNVDPREIERRWQEMFDTLREYKHAYGDTLVPKNYENLPGLYVWCQQQLAAHRSKIMEPDHRTKLDSIGFVWEPASLQKEEQWDAMFLKLKAYRAATGNCSVPRYWKNDLSLGGWVGRNRHLGRQGKLSKGRKAKLDSIQFNWGNFRDKRLWEKQFDKLVDYQAENGHCSVPLDYSDKSLSNWVKYQRQRDKIGLMRKVERDKLDTIGFSWCQASEIEAEGKPATKRARRKRADAGKKRKSVCDAGAKKHRQGEDGEEPPAKKARAAEDIREETPAKKARAAEDISVEEAAAALVNFAAPPLTDAIVKESEPAVALPAILSATQILDRKTCELFELPDLGRASPPPQTAAV